MQTELVPCTPVRTIPCKVVSAGCTTSQVKLAGYDSSVRLNISTSRTEKMYKKKSKGCSSRGNVKAG